MTGSIDTSTGGKLRAVFLAFVMVGSVFGATIAFSGSAAADANGLSNAAVTDINTGTDGVTQTARVDVDIDNTQDTISIDVDNSETQDIVNSVVSATAVTDTGSGTGLTVVSSTANSDGTVDVTVSGDSDTGSADGTLVVKYALDATTGAISTTGAENTDIAASDGSGSATGISFTVDSAANGPQITSAQTLDEGNSGAGLEDSGSKTGTADNGEVDIIVVTFDKNVDDSTLEKEDFLTGSIGGGTAVDGVTTGDTRLEGGVDSDNKIALEVSALSADDTAVTPSISYDVNGDGDQVLTAAGGGGSSGDQDGVVTATDNAEPAIIGANTADTNDNGNIDQITAKMSENIDDDAADSDNDEFTGQGAVSIASNDLGSGSTDDSDVVLTLSTEVSGTGVLANADNTIIQVGGEVTGNSNSITQSSDVTTTTSDTAQPIITDFTGNTGSSQATVSFSEQVDGAGGNLVSSDFRASFGSSDVTSITGVSTTSQFVSTATINLNNQITQNDLGSDQIQPSGSPSDIQDNAGNNIDAIGTTITLTSGSAALPGSTNNDMKFQIDSDTTAEVVAGSANESVGAITLKDDASNGRIAFASDIVITLPQGITVNQSASALNTQNIITSDSGGVVIDSVSVDNSDNQGEITLSTSGQSNPGEEILFKTGILILNVDGDAVDTTGSRSTLDITVDNFQGEAPLPNAIDVRSITATAPNNGGPRNLAAGSENLAGGGNGFTGNEDVVQIAAGDVLSTIEGTDQPLIGNNTQLVYTLESDTGVSFDTDQFGSDLLASEDIDDGDTAAELDESAITVNSKQIIVPVVDSIDDSDATASNPIELQNLVYQTTGDAVDADLNVTVESPPVSSGAYITDSSSTSVGTITDYATVDNPDVFVDNSPSKNLAVGEDEQRISEGSGTIGSNRALEITNAQIGADTNVTIETNSSAVTFDTSQTAVTEDSGITQNDDDTLEVAFDTGSNTRADAEAVTINENSIEISVTNGQSNIGDTLELGDIKLNVSANAVDDTDVEFTVTSRTAPGRPEITVSSTESGTDTNQFFTLQRSDIEFNGNADQAANPANSQNITTDLDADGFNGREITGAGSDAIVIDPTVGASITDETNVTISLQENTGVTFDTTASTSFSTGGLSNALGDTNIDVNEEASVTNAGDSSVTVNEKSIDITLSSGDTSFDSITDVIVVDDLIVNATGAASPTQVSVTTNTSDAEVTTNLRQITFDRVEASNIRVDPDTDTSGFNPGSFTFGADQQVNKPTVDTSISSGVEVQDGGSAFGGATVNFEIVETPDGSSGAQLNTTQATTDSNGNAFFNFTAGDTTGDYVVNATVESTGAGVNVTYTAQPGGVAGLSVTPIENAIAGDGSEVGTASLFINATDANGNPVAQSATISLTADGVGAGDVTAFDDKASDGTGTSQSDNLQDGQFSLDSDGSSVIDVDSSQVENVTITAETSGESDDGTVTFFDQVGGIDLSLNETSVAVDDTVSADATITEEDGTTIEVPDVNVDFDDNNNGNTTFDADADSESATTNDAGVASVNVTAEQNGTSTIDASSNLRTASATLTIEQQQQQQQEPSVSVNFTDQTVPNGTEEVTVDSANFTRADGSAGDYVVVVHTIDEFGAPVGEVSSPIGASGDLTGAEENITVNLTAADGPIDSITQNVTLRAMLHTTNDTSAFGTRLGAAIDGIERGDETDDANITVEEDAGDAPELTPDERAANFDEAGNNNGVLDPGELINAISQFRNGNLTPSQLIDLITIFQDGGEIETQT